MKVAIPATTKLIAVPEITWLVLILITNNPNNHDSSTEHNTANNSGRTNSMPPTLGIHKLNSIPKTANIKAPNIICPSMAILTIPTRSQK